MTGGVPGVLGGAYLGDRPGADSTKCCGLFLELPLLLVPPFLSWEHVVSPAWLHSVCGTNGRQSLTPKLACKKANPVSSRESGGT